MWRSVIVSTSQDDKRLSVELDCTAFEVSCNSCNSDS